MLLFDIVHPVDINFYKFTIKKMIKQNIPFICTIRNRGRIVDIFRKEFPNLPYIVSDNHKKNFIKKIISIPLRNQKLFTISKKYKVTSITSFCGFYGGLSSFLLKIPNIIFTDDIEYRLNYELAYLNSTELYVMPKEINDTRKKVKLINSFKELAYLHPNVFHPSQKVLNSFSLNPYDYVFFRDKEYVSMNYYKKIENIKNICSILQKMKKKSNKEIVILTFDKNNSKFFKKNNFVTIDEPLDIFSLLKFSYLTISYGDSLIRESSLLGVLSLYLGRRKMAINRPLINVGILKELSDIKQILDITFTLEELKIIRENLYKKILNDWDDMNTIIYNAIIK